MYNVLLVIHIMVTLSLIGIILMQRSASDGMGLSGGSSSSFLSGRAAASAVTRTTAILATLFILTSLCLDIVIAHTHTGEVSIMDRIDASKPASPSNPAPLVPTQNPLQAPATTNSANPAPANPTPMNVAPVAPATVVPAPAPVKPSVPRPEE